MFDRNARCPVCGGLMEGFSLIVAETVAYRCQNQDCRNYSRDEYRGVTVDEVDTWTAEHVAPPPHPETFAERSARLELLQTAARIRAKNKQAVS